MSNLPDWFDLLTLDYGYMGRPFVLVTSSNSDPPADTGYMGAPFISAPTGAAPPPPTHKPAVLFCVSM